MQSQRLGSDSCQDKGAVNLPPPRHSHSLIQDEALTHTSTSSLQRRAHVVPGGSLVGASYRQKFGAGLIVLVSEVQQ